MSGLHIEGHRTENIGWLRAAELCRRGWLGLVFLGFIFHPILGFGDATYDGAR